MKKTRLLEIIREEIDTAIKEIPAIAKDSDLLKEIEQLAEMASMKQLKDQLEKQNMDSELKAVKAAEKSTIEKLSKDPVFSGTGNNQRLKGYVKNLKKELKDTHDINLQNLLSKVSEKAGDKFNDDIATNTIEKNAANKVLGKEPGKRGRKASEKKEEPTTSKSEPKAKAREKDDEEKEAEAAVGTDSTAKSLGAKAERMAQVQKFTDKMKDEGVVGDDNKILDAKKYKEEFAKFKAKLK